jgi:SAM-dependent methyltransferase
MTQITSGTRKILSFSLIYSLFQFLMGASKFRFMFIKDFLKVKENDIVLDIGCGPADILDHIPSYVKYIGFDISSNYIIQAKKKYGDRADFFCKILDSEDLNILPKFDYVILMGVLHHLDDKDALKVIQLSYEALKPGGRLLTVDPCFTPNQNKIAKFLISQDRGQNVRIEENYKLLPSPIFSSTTVNVINRLWIPYTHCIMNCVK